MGATDAVQAVLRSYGTVRSLVVGQYGEASLDTHELMALAAEQAAQTSWGFLGARSVAEARAYFTASMRRSWGCLFVREMARHRLRRVCYIGAGHRPRAVQAQGVPAGEWGVRSPMEFWAFRVRGRGGAGGAQAARGGAPRRA